MTRKKRGSASAAADKLREIVFERENGAYLGSQDDLVRMLGIGRVTLHQCARVLEQERLLKVRRGVNGGYYGTRPDEAGVENAVAIYLRANKTNFAEVLQITSALSAELHRLASHSSDEAAREELQKVAQRLEDETASESAERLLEIEAAFVDAVLRLAANPLGALMLKLSYRIFFETAPGNLLPAQEGREYWRKTRLSMARAILAREEDYVDVLSRRFSAYIHERLKELNA